MGKSIYIDTLGCRTNVADSSLLGAHLLAAGYQLAPSADEADIVLINSCTVTLGADRDVGKTLRRLRRLRPEVRLVVTGCLPRAQADHRVLADADCAVAGNDPEAVLRQLGPASPLDRGAAPGQTVPAVSRRSYEAALGLSRANIKIHEGCDCNCTYCIVPTARGGPSSRPVADVLQDVEAALDAGFEELVITGTHLARYGVERGDDRGLVELMAKLEGYADQCRFRLSSLEPDRRLPEIIDRLADHDCWCRHVHLALQHGSDEVLKAMRRPYRFAEVAAALHHLAARLPDANVGTDFIVGFPTETEAHFADGFAKLQELPMHYLHVFSYSPRPGTPAASWKPQATSAEVKERSRRLRDFADQRQQAFVRSQAGTERTVLVEQRRDGRTGYLRALTDNYLQVTLDGPDSWMGTRKVVRLEQAADGTLLGRLLDGME